MSLGRVARWMRAVRIVDAAIVLGLALYWLSLALFPSIWNRWPLRSHYYYQNKEVLRHLGWNALPLGLTIAGLVALTWKQRRATLGILLLLLAAAVAFQWSTSFLNGLNANRLSSTLLATQDGHSEFVRRAYEEPHPIEMAWQYESRCDTEEPRSYIQTKPPGHLLFYSIAAQLYRLLPAQATCEWLALHAGFARRDPFTAFGVFATILLSIVSCLPVIVLARLGVRIEEGGNPLSYGLTFLLCPATALITMHLDQVLYPLLVCLTLLAAALAAQRHAAIGTLAGGLAYLSIYASFSLGFLVPTVGLWWFAHLWLRPELRRRILCAGLFFVLGMLVCYATLRWGLGFEVVHAYQRAMAHHAAWRDTTGLVGARGTLRNFVEAALWLGIPASVLCAAQWLRSVRAAARCLQYLASEVSEFLVRGFGRREPPASQRRPDSLRAMDPFALFVLLYPLIVIGVSTYGHAVREIGRLWIPLLIPAQLAAARELNEVHRERASAFVLLASLAVVLRANYHDFR
jgi:hypothetical protein